MTIKNLGRWALVSGIVLGVSALTPLAVLADPIEVKVNDFSNLTFTAENDTLILYNKDGTIATESSVGNVAYQRNIVGKWEITMSSTNAGKLKSTGGVEIPYNVKLIVPSHGGSNLNPGTGNAQWQSLTETRQIATGEIADATGETGITDASANLQVQIASGLKVPNQIYRDTITLTLTTDVAE
ncbi:MAG: hypothetical protein ACXITR_00030 [Cyanobacterium sp.]